MTKVVEGLYYSESHEFVKVAGNVGYIGITDYAQHALGNIVGKVLEINEALEDEPGLLNKDAFDNWIIKVELSDTSELKDLMDSKAYEEFCSED